MKKAIIYCMCLCGQIMLSQTGIGVEVPTEMLDVNGSMRIRNTDYLEDVNAKPLYGNSEGLLGVRNILGAHEVVFAAEGLDTVLPVGSVVTFNSGGRIEIPMKESDIVMNSLKVTRSGDYFRIEYAGQYTYNLSINLNTNVVDIYKDHVAVSIELESSSNNGVDWKLISSNSFALMRDTYLKRLFVSGIKTLVLPPFIYEHQKGELIRMSVIRSKDETTQQLKGNTVTLFDLSTEGGLRAYNIVINKL